MSAPNPSSKPSPATPPAGHALMSMNPAGAGELHGSAADDTASNGGRKHVPDADEEKAAQLGIGPQSAAATAYIRPVNLRRSSHALQLFGLLFVVILILFGAMLAGIFSFYEKNIQPHLVAARMAPPAPAPEVPSALKIDIPIPPETRAEITAATEKITELQKQIDAIRDSFSTTDGRLKELGERVSSVASSTSQTQPRPADIPPTQATEPKPEGEVAAIVPVTTSTNQELVLLKERNRLTAWADEAIATGSRKSLDNLIKRLTDPEHANLRDASFAEIQRIYYHLRYTIRIDPNFRIPVNELFKDAGIRDESDLNTGQVIKLLHDQEQIWQVRLRAAWLLGGRRTTDVNEALIKAIKDDPVLDVAKEAQLSLEQNIDRKFLLLDIPAIDEWWKSQASPPDGSKEKDKDETGGKPKSGASSGQSDKKKSK